ncbi:chorismate-binding protein [Blattabacterium cuenoti]|uniref:chorismate-binding protein n=1 Tax=Blattabacterium cuenoti TaxID=1653831 RepID=UPI00163D1F12|nr:chorismate-binding protein [Blattabacterium cuenoti]
MLKKIKLFQLYRKIIKNYHNKNKFVILKKPFENKIYFYYEHQSQGLKYFFIQDFYHEKTIKIFYKTIYYTDLNVEDNKKDFLKKNFSYLIPNSSDYLKLIKKSIFFIKKKLFDKVVVSRTVKIPFEKFFFKKTFQHLILNYSNTLISIWYDPLYGTWIGNTPELLMECIGKKLKTIALAGTIWDSNTWGKKELREHKIVIRYIIDLLLQYYQGKLFVYPTIPLKIGSIKHLKTIISFDFLEKPDYYEILNLLHPTPSICGFPKNQSMYFIKKNEPFHREFYTGSIGIIDNISMELYVNLRCAKVYKKKITLYAGSGVTYESNVYQEYIETEQKIINVLSYLHFI